VWATQAHNERKLNAAYESSDEVRLVFSVNNSGHFQGYAKMTSAIGHVPSQAWQGAHRGIGGTFKLEWLCLFDLPFSQTEHLENALNDRKPIKISRDGQELTCDTGDAVCQLFEDGIAASCDSMAEEKEQAAATAPGTGGDFNRAGGYMASAPARLPPENRNPYATGGVAGGGADRDRAQRGRAASPSKRSGTDLKNKRSRNPEENPDADWGAGGGVGLEQAANVYRTGHNHAVIRAATAAVVSKAVAAAVVKEVAAAQAARPPEVPMMAAPVVVSVPVVPASRPHRSPNHLRA